ncbi:uncharacterized protein LOC135690007 [Rhopilema esculentum]|uniref:uncharacterized protein LOC135690007 n=1 Tax=Rhopilema esculentum TaxID=499914 RepID=UPI0031E022C3
MEQVVFILVQICLVFSARTTREAHSKLSKLTRCTYETVLSNHTFSRNKQAGVFTHLGRAADIHKCKQMCCEKADCDVAFMPQNHCYAVSCYSDEHCETTPASVSNFVVQLVKVRRVTIPDPYNESPKEEDIWKSGNQESSKENLNEEVTLQTSNAMEAFICTHSPVLYNVTLRGASKSGIFTDLGSVDNINMCIALCCELQKCDLAFMIGQTCVAVKCHSEELCQTIKAKPSKLAPQLAYIRRKEVQKKVRPVAAQPQIQSPPILQKPPQKQSPILRPSTCQTRKIYNNVTLLGGTKAGNYTSLGKAEHLQDCVGRACDLNEGHVALMIGRYCFSVTCHNERVCQTIPAKPTQLKPKVAYLAWTQEPIEPDTITNMAESDFFVNHHRFPRCKRSHIMYNHTLKGGLRAGNFSMLAAVNDIEVCAALCCEEKNCDLALMIGDNCYAGDCTSPDLCKAVPIPPGMVQRSQIAYITAPGRKKPEDKWVNADWSLVYLIVSSLVIGISLLGTAWTVCLCVLKRHRTVTQDEEQAKAAKRTKTLRDLRARFSDGLPSFLDSEAEIEEPVGTSTRGNSFSPRKTPTSSLQSVATQTKKEAELATERFFKLEENANKPK